MSNPNDVITKVYYDGTTGNYFCQCLICKRQFVGDKRDMYCGQDDCIEPEQQEE